MKPITDVHELFHHQRAIRNFTAEVIRTHWSIRS